MGKVYDLYCYSKYDQLIEIIIDRGGNMDCIFIKFRGERGVNGKQQKLIREKENKRVLATYKIKAKTREKI